MASTNNKIYTENELSDFYGPFIKRSAMVAFEESDVPTPLRVLIPYAKFWGSSDDWTREQLISDSSMDIKSNLKCCGPI
jgi:hypothetical protein